MSATSECLDENTIVALFESRLEGGEKERAEEHLASCASCRRLLAEYAAMAPGPNVTAPMSPATAGTAGDAGSRESAESTDEDRADLGRRVAHAQAAKRVGTVLCKKWKIERVIGIGGMAQVFQATHSRNGRAVAVKVMRPELAVEPMLVERFLREGYVANKVDHPGAVAILDDDLAPDGAPFLVLELLRGRTLASRLHESGRLPVDEALRVTASVLEVLAAAHDKGIVHRDVKPDNLFETESGDVKVLDFGIARLREGLGGRGHTQSGVMMGTLGYMPPEQARGQGDELDARSDLWAVGATLLTLTTGRAPHHDAASPNEALLRSMTVRVPPVATIAPDLPSAVTGLLDTALAFEKGARFSDARAMLAAVVAARRSSEVLRSESVNASASGPLPPGSPQTGSLRGVSAPSEAAAEMGRHGPASTASARSVRPRVVLVGVLATLAIGGAVTVATVSGRGKASAADADAPRSSQVPSATVAAEQATAARPEPAVIASTAQPPPAPRVPSSARATPPAASSLVLEAGAATPEPRAQRPVKALAAHRDAAAPSEPPAPPTLDPLGPRR